MRQIADHRLVEIPDLNFDLAVRIGEWPKVADMSVAANPDAGARRNAFLRSVTRPAIR